MLVALKFIKALRETIPDQPVVLACTTSTAHELALARTAGLCHLIYQPLDLPWAVRSAFLLVRPRLVVLVESELWPNLLARARRDGIPVVLVNARLSPRSERRYHRFRALTRPLFDQLRHVYVQAPEDGERWGRLGVPARRISCPGSIKFDQAAQPYPEAQIQRFGNLLNALRGGRRGPVILAGSTHAGEEKLVAEAFLRVRQTFPDAFLILVPRHFERGETVLREVRSTGLEPVLKTDLGEDPGSFPARSADCCLVVNTTGELWAWYHLADVVLIGKTFLSDEGQNPIEPILAGKPVVTGPEMKNFASLAERLLQSGGMVRVSGAAALPGAILGLLQDPARAAATVEGGRSVVALDQGAARRTAEAIASMEEEMAALEGRSP